PLSHPLPTQHYPLSLHDALPISLENNLEMAAVVLGGLPSSVVKRIGAFLGIRATKVGSIVKINEKTLDRRLKSGCPETRRCASRSEEHTSELQSQSNLVCRLLLE